MYTIRRNILVLLIFSTLVNSAFSGEVVARVEIPSMMNIIQNLSLYMENVSHGSSAMLASGIVALTFSPEYRDLDFTRPIQLYLCSKDVDDGDLDWYIVMSKKVKKLSNALESNRLGLKYKEIGRQIILSRSQKLLDSIKSVEKSVPTKSDIYLKLFPSIYFKSSKRNFSGLRQSLIQKISEKSGESIELASLKSLNVKFNNLEKLLAQVNMSEFNLEIREDRISVLSQIKPCKESEMEKLLAQQVKEKHNLTVFSGENTISGGIDIFFSDQLRKSLSELVSDIAIEVSVDEQGLEYLEIIDQILMNCTGNIGYCTGELNKLPLTTFRMGYYPKKLGDLVKKIRSGNYSTEIDNVYKLSTLEFKDGDFLTLYAIINGDDVWLIYGKISPGEALDVMKQQNRSSSIEFNATPYTAVIRLSDMNTKNELTKLFFKFRPKFIEMKFDILANVVAKALPSSITNRKKKRTRIKF